MSEQVDMFDPDDHVYRDEHGRAYPSVTEIISEVWPIDKRWYRESSTNLGTEVHEATALIDKGLMTLEDFEGDVRVLSHVWETFLQRLDCELLIIEQPAIARKYGFGFTTDRVVKLKEGDVAILDIKTGAPAKWHELQLGAYALGVEEKYGIQVSRGFTVHLEAGRAARPKEHDVLLASSAFRNLMLWRSYRGRFS